MRLFALVPLAIALSACTPANPMTSTPPRSSEVAPAPASADAILAAQLLGEHQSSRFGLFSRYDEVHIGRNGHRLALLHLQ